MIDLKVNVNVNLGLLLTPNIDLSLKVLAMNVLEIEEKIKELSEENPLLKIDDDININKQAIDFDIEKQYRELDESFKERFYNDEGVDILEATIADSETLQQSLEKQFRLEYNLDNNEYDIAHFMIYNINEKGFLDVSLNEVEKRFDCSMDTINDIRHKIMKLDPIGCGSLNAIEFLKFQVDYYNIPNREDFFELIDALYQTTSPNIKKIKNKLKLDDDTFSNALKEISNFSFYPFEHLSFVDNRIYIEPDVYIKKIGDKYIAVLNEKNLSRVHIDENLFREYAEDLEAKGFVEERLKQAKQFLLAISQRNKTLLKTVNLIIEKQDSFFKNGVIMPLTRRDIAENLGYNVSTITRAVSNKYVEYDGKIIPLKDFFSFGVNKSVSKSYIKNTINKLLQQEDKRNPLNDDEIKAILEKQGINITRRTVTKYRKELNIPNSRQRKCQII